MGCACGTGGSPSFEGAGTSECIHHRNDAGTANQTDVNHLDSGSKTKKILYLAHNLCVVEDSQADGAGELSIQLSGGECLCPWSSDL